MGNSWPSSQRTCPRPTLGRVPRDRDLGSACLPQELFVRHQAPHKSGRNLCPTGPPVYAGDPGLAWRGQNIPLKSPAAVSAPRPRLPHIRKLLSSSPSSCKAEKTLKKDYSGGFYLRALTAHLTSFLGKTGSLFQRSPPLEGSTIPLCPALGPPHFSTWADTFLGAAFWKPRACCTLLPFP